MPDFGEGRSRASPVTGITDSLRPLGDSATVSDSILVREWTPDQFHRHVLDLEKKGYLTRRETYSITPEVNPETGEISHLYCIELVLPDPECT